MSASRPDVAPPRFQQAVAELNRMRWRPEISVEEIGAPTRIAPHSIAVAAEFTDAGELLASGRLVLLHDPVGNEAWRGTFRIVSYARAQVDLDMVADPLLPEVAWSWMLDALRDHEATYAMAAGTVTASHGKAFGEMEGTEDKAEVEIRSSWTPLLGEGELAPHLLAWQELLGHVSGRPFLPTGVVAFPGRA